MIEQVILYLQFFLHSAKKLETNLVKNFSSVFLHDVEKLEINLLFSVASVQKIRSTLKGPVYFEAMGDVK